jgi:tetratricopeptide (TPR) repeat protein
LDLAIQCFRQALALDPNYALAWAKLARVYIVQTGSPGHPVSATEPQARDALQRALALDPDSAVAHRWLGRIYLHFLWDWAAATRELRRAVTLDPDGPEGDSAQGDLEVIAAFTTGQFDEGIQHAIRNLRTNPLDTGVLSVLTWLPEFAGRHELAAKYQRQLIELDPEHAEVHGAAAVTALAIGSPTDALTEAEKETDEETRQSALARVYWKLGRSVEATGALNELERKFSQDAAYDVAIVHAYRGEIEIALDWLERAYQQHDPEIMWLKVDPLLASLHGKPRYLALMKRMNLEP